MSDKYLLRRSDNWDGVGEFEMWDTRPMSVVTAHEAAFDQMTVVVEFDSYEIALAALGSGVERDVRIAEGV